MNYWEIIADNLSKAGWSWGCGSEIDSNERTIWIADSHRGDGRRFVVRADEKLRRFWNWKPQFGLAPNWLDTLERFLPSSTSLTDVNQAEDFPPLGSSPLPDPQFQRINSAGKKEGRTI